MYHICILLKKFYFFFIYVYSVITFDDTLLSYELKRKKNDVQASIKKGILNFKKWQY